jgi:hypothetical protein
MEVPCCGGLPMMIKRAVEDAGVEVPQEQVIIGITGEILRRDKMVA